VDAPAPIDRMPLYVRAGSIIPFGPQEEYATQKPSDPSELRVYPGADGSFMLYEDENDSYHYENGAYATIPIQWNNSTRTLAPLTLGARKGSFPGMLENRTFRILFVSENHGGGIESAASPDQSVQYSGREVSVTQE